MNVISLANKKYHLIVSDDMIKMSQKDIESKSNGCGDRFTKEIVPNIILGLNITVACIIHDLDFYNIRVDLKSKKITYKEAKKLVKDSNKKFYKNMKIIAKYEKRKNQKGVSSFYFWNKDVIKARLVYNIHRLFIKAYKCFVDLFGYNSLINGM